MLFVLVRYLKDSTPCRERVVCWLPAFLVRGPTQDGFLRLPPFLALGVQGPSVLLLAFPSVGLEVPSEVVATSLRQAP